MDIVEKIFKDIDKSIKTSLILKTNIYDELERLKRKYYGKTTTSRNEN
jgi:hypothetical protein